MSTSMSRRKSRIDLIQRMEQEQLMQDVEDCKFTEEERAMLFATFRHVQVDLHDLDGLTWSEPAARRHLAQWYQAQVFACARSSSSSASPPVQSSVFPSADDVPLPDSSYDEFDALLPSVRSASTSTTASVNAFTSLAHVILATHRSAPKGPRSPHSPHAPHSTVRIASDTLYGSELTRNETLRPRRTPPAQMQATPIPWVDDADITAILPHPPPLPERSAARPPRTPTRSPLRPPCTPARSPLRPSGVHATDPSTTASVSYCTPTYIEADVPRAPPRALSASAKAMLGALSRSPRRVLPRKPSGRERLERVRSTSGANRSPRMMMTSNSISGAGIIMSHSGSVAGRVVSNSIAVVVM